MASQEGQDRGFPPPGGDSMRRRATATAALLALAALAIVAAASAKADRAPAPSAQAGNAAALVKCGKTRSIGLMAPFTGPAASIGTDQVAWAQYYQRTYNATHKKTKSKFVNEDTMLGAANGTAESVKGAQALASNGSVLGVVGPAGSNEVKATTGALKGAGLGFVSGSATNTQITLDGTRTGYFFRTVPPDSSQSLSVSAFIAGQLNARRVYIVDDQEAYSIGLADEVQSQLKAKGIAVGRDGVSQQQSDFSAIINKIPRDVDVIYLPWQLPPKGQAFGQQMKGLGRGSVKLMGSDGLFDPAFAGLGSNVYDSFFPVNPADKRVKAFARLHGGQTEFFGA